jgi:hypothetical protein
MKIGSYTLKSLLDGEIQQSLGLTGPSMPYTGSPVEAAIHTA